MSALATELVDTPGDMHASSAYRRRLLTVLAARQLAAAYTRAAGEDPARARAGVRSSPGAAPTRPRSAPPAPLTPADGRVTTHLTVNGKPVTLTLPPRVTLADALRDHLGLTGTHLGCEHGVCGACTVLVDDKPVRSCLMFAVQAEGARVRTVEGLANGDKLHPLQQAFWDHHGLQCGFCTPGFLMLAVSILEPDPDIAESELREALSSNLCRCTGYQNILKSVLAASAEMRK
jgi:aerobic carbon-monoxide dehydrogenase small subunit